MLEKEEPLFVLWSIQHTEIKSVGRMQNLICKLVAHIVVI